MAALAAGVMAGAVLAGPAEARKLDLSTPDGAVTAMRRIWCTMEDGEPVVWYWQGEAYSRRQGEADKKLFNVMGMNVRTCGAITDPERGPGVRSVSRELLIYTDPATGKTLSKWTNPWTDEVVDVVHVANDPVNGDFLPKGRDGKPTQWRGVQLGDSWYMSSTVPLFYKNVLGGEYQAEVGGTYHATEMFNFMGDVESLTNLSKPTATVDVAWVRMSDWLPWMKMGGRDGLIYFNTAGRKLAKASDLPKAMQDEIAAHYPDYKSPPPLDDKRPNETSWTYFKKVREGAAKAPKRD
jgi:hypothetical protein